MDNMIDLEEEEEEEEERQAESSFSSIDFRSKYDRNDKNGRIETDMIITKGKLQGDDDTIILYISLFSFFSIWYKLLIFYLYMKLSTEQIFN